jgi:hypothetical protein
VLSCLVLASWLSRSMQCTGTYATSDKFTSKYQLFAGICAGVCWKKKLHGLSLQANYTDNLYGPVVRVSCHRSRGSRVPRFNSRRYQIFWEVVGLERGTIEDLLWRNSSGFGLENRAYDRGDPLRWPRDILYSQKLALTSSACGGCSVGIVCWIFL